MSDVNGTDERLFELYQEECHRTHTKATIHDYLIWLEENYD